MPAAVHGEKNVTIVFDAAEAGGQAENATMQAAMKPPAMRGATRALFRMGRGDFTEHIRRAIDSLEMRIQYAAVVVEVERLEPAVLRHD